MFVRSLIAFLLLGPASAQQKQITVAAASDMSFALKEIAEKYEKQTGTNVRMIFGSSGNLYQQIRNGSPVDLFLSADEQYPAKLVEEGLGIKETRKRYARGFLVLWVPASSKLDVETLHEKALLDSSVSHIAMANPATAPYGRGAKAAFVSWRYWNTLQPKIVFGENVSQTAQFVQSGNSEVGLISLSHALSEPLRNGKFWRIDQEIYAAIYQSMVVIERKDGDVNEGKRFADYLLSNDAREILTRFGFELPEQDRASKAPKK